jgi:hypothetical protein
MANSYRTKIPACPVTVYNSPMQRSALRHDWTRDDVRALYNTGLLELLFEAQATHRQYFDPDEVQLCQLLSIKPAAALKIARIVRRARTIKPKSVAKTCSRWITF